MIRKIKTITISLLALAAVFAGCSKSSPEAGEDAWVLDDSLPVPIKFGSSGKVMTKASVESLSNLDRFWTLGIDKDKTGVDWSADSPLVVLNAQEGFFGDAIGEGEGSYYSLQFGSREAPTKKYYPLESRYNYSFYGYYVGGEASIPASQSADLDFTDNVASVGSVTVGRIDYLWAEATATDIVIDEGEHAGTWKGFNARYARRAKEKGEYEAHLPDMSIKHVTTCLRFKAMAADEDAYNSFFDEPDPDNPAHADENAKIFVKKIVLEGVDTTARFVIADNLSENSQKGSLQPLGEEKGTVTVDGLSVIPTVDGVEIADGFFLIPGDMEGVVVKVYFRVSGEDQDQFYEVKNLKTVASVESFEKGKSYTFNVIFNSIEEISIKANLDEWDNSPEDSNWDPDDHLDED